MEPRVLSLPEGVEMFSDARGEQRSMRLTWHHESDLVVLSLWRDGSCVGTLRLPREDVPRLIGALTAGLAVPPAEDETTPRHRAS
jgi:hypothetical protein